MPRVEIPLIGPAHTNRERGLSSQTAKNMWPEINPEARNQVALHNGAGLGVFATLEGIDRGMHEFNNLQYAVNGGTLYSVDADGVNTNLGSIGTTNRCVMANDSTQLIITTGDTPYRYTVAGGVEAITDPDLTKPTSVAYLNSQFIFDNNNGIWGEFVTSSIEAGLSVDALDFAQAESHPDDIIRVMAWRQLVYFFGSHSVEPWQNTGVGNPPFARYDVGVKPYGLAGTHAIIATAEAMYFLDTKRIPRRTDGVSYPSIGTPAIGVEFAKYTRIDDCIAFEFTQDNQQFVAFTFPTANRTWCYHEPSGTWFQMTYGIGDDRHRASSMMHIYGLNYCADHTNGLIYEYSLDIHSDNGSPIIKERTTAAIHGGLFDVPGKRLYYDSIELIILSGVTDVAGTGLGPQPINVVAGVCGTSNDLTQGQLLNVSPISQANTTLAVVESVGGVGTYSDTKVVSFTCALIREFAPDAGFGITAFQVFSTANNNSNFRFFMDENGYMNITARNTANTEILNVKITYNGSSFADSDTHFFAVVIDLSDTAKREIYVDATNVGESTWTTWNTYTDDTIGIADTILQHKYGVGNGEAAWGATDSVYNGNGTANGIDALGYISFDDSCSLICSAVWDINGYVRDPQKWEGWYKTQPQVFFGPSFWRNTGKTGPTTYGTGLELKFTETHKYTFAGGINPFQTANTVLNKGIAGTTEVGSSGGGGLPPAPPPDPQVEIVAPFWLNTGNWINLSALTQTTFAGMFGLNVEGPDFSAAFTVNKAALVNTSDSGNRIQIRDTAVCSNAALFITDSSGNVVDTMIYAGVPNGDSVLIPTGSDHYVVITSDTGSATVKKWDVSGISTVGSTPWIDFFGVPFGNNVIYDSTQIIPAAGISLRLDVPSTTTAYKVNFSSIEVTGIATTRTGSVNQTVGDYTSAPTHVWGQSGGITGGINFAGQDIDLIPGETYFFNVRNDSPITNNWIRLQVTQVAQ